MRALSSELNETLPWDSLPQLRQALIHVAIYAGVPAANHAFKLAKEQGWGDTL